MGDTRLSRLLADVVPQDPGEAGAGDKGGLPRLLIHNLNMSDGKGRVRDNVPPTPVELPLGPINISIHELNTLPDRHGDQNVTIILPNDASLHWEGSLTLAPLDSEGEPGALAHDSPWQLGLDELIIEGGSLDLADQSVNPAIEVGVRELQFKMTLSSNQDGGLLPLGLAGNFEQGGNFGLEGKLALLPELSFIGSLHTQAVPLDMVETYSQQFAPCWNRYLLSVTRIPRWTA